VKKITEATATEVATVDEKIVRKMAIPRSRWCASTARPSPRMMPAGTVCSAKRTVTPRLCRSSRELSTSAYWSSPTQSLGRPGKGGVRKKPRWIVLASG